MEKITPWLTFYYIAIFFQLCNGYSNNLEETLPVSEQNPQLLTGIFGVLLTVCSLIFIMGCLCCQRRNKFKVFQNSPGVECVTSETADPGYVNPVVNGEFTIFTPLSPPYNNNVVLSRNSENSNVNGDLTLLKKWYNHTESDFPRMKLKYVQEMGRGKFGKVVEGAAQCLDNNGEIWTPVVVRILDSSSTIEERIQFLKDASLYKYGGHPNVLSLIGRCFETIPLLLIQEYCQGDLKSYLNRISKESTVPSHSLLWCSQLTSALKFLHGHQIVHPDLASRNCQLNSNMDLKLGDYGLGMYKYPADYYQNIPIRWCDPECIYFDNHSVKIKQLSPLNNIWSLGVTIWEICQCGQPYVNLTDEDILQLIKLKNKLSKPSRSSAWLDNMYEIMQLCWSDVEIRPHIVEIDLLVSELSQTYSSTEQKLPESADEFDQKWNMLSPKTAENTDVCSDSVLIEMGDDYEVTSSKPLSPSLNNLHGSLDNLIDKCEQSQLSFNDSIRSNCDSDSSCLESFGDDKTLSNQYSTEVLKSLSSDSETEDDNWRVKVERGTYTEKVRVKSKSITDLMVLTHIDFESESDTPFPSLNYKVNCKNPRNPSSKDFPFMSFGSEGNLLSIQDNVSDKAKVNDEFKKFQEDYNYNQVIPNNSEPKLFQGSNSFFNIESNNQLNIQPQIFNVYNITTDNLPNLNNMLSDNLSNYVLPTTAQKCTETVFTNPHLLHVSEKVCDNNLEDIKKSNADTKNSELNHQQVENNDMYSQLQHPTPSNEIDKQNSNNKDLKENVQEAEENYNMRKTECTASFTESNGQSIENSYLEQSRLEAGNNYTNSERKLLTSEISKISTEKENFEPHFQKAVMEVPLSVEEGNKRTLESKECAENPQEGESNDSCSEANKLKTSAIEINNVITINTIPPKKDLSNEVTSENSNSSVVPYLLYKTIQLKIQFNNFTSITLYNILIEPYSKNGHIKSLLALSNTFFEKKLNFKEYHELNSLNDSGPKSIIIFNTMDKEALKKTEDHPTLTAPINVWSGKSSTDMFDDENITNLDYSLKTWDDFLDKTLHEQRDGFYDFSNEPKSLIFLNDSSPVNESKDTMQSNYPEVTVDDESENECDKEDSLEGDRDSDNDDCIDQDVNNLTFTKEDASELNVNNEDSSVGSWEKNEGWYLHSQPKEEVSGEMEIDSTSGEGYVGFGIDEELMSAVRDELIKKLPHAQKACMEQVVDDNEWDSQERDEVFLRYNVYNTPLPPIPEESLCEDDSELDTPKGNCDDDSDWSAQCEPPQDTESQSSHTLEVTKHCHTLSESSCCSNDTLFNLEELNFAPNEAEKRLENSPAIIEESEEKNDLNSTFSVAEKGTTDLKLLCSIQQNMDFLLNEKRYNDVSNFDPHETKCQTSEAPNEAPNDVKTESLNESPTNDLHVENLETYSNTDSNMSKQVIEIDDSFENTNYDTVDIDYSQFVDVENAKNSLEYEGCRTDGDYINIIDKNPNSDEDKIFEILADIRFSGPTDSQLMSTSFTESNTCDEKEWDSGSDSRSSSSGEFIWKEGEREESLKALKTVHQELEEANDDRKNPFVESDISSTFSDDEDRETPEFVPSAWDKFAMPVKSALRSPEKTLNRNGNKKPKVWFKKQKYHCIYEYPKEPESPIFQKEVHWHNDLRTFQDWEFDNEPFTTEVDDSDITTDYLRRSRSLSNNKNLYQLTDVSDFMFGMSGMDEKFFVSSSSRPFDMDGSSSSQFFPGNSSWVNVENATPDSGVEDIATPSSSIDSREYPEGNHAVPSLKRLASNVIKKNSSLVPSKTDDILGGLRHTRNKLKLELPPSPSAFTAGRMFTIDNSNHEPLPRETPTFTTFGKSRFLVQHIDTPNESKSKNVSFEALPYKPLNQVFKESHIKNNETIVDVNAIKVEIESVKGEASLLDSTDEDSGIESSTLEKKLNT